MKRLKIYLHDFQAVNLNTGQETVVSSTEAMEEIYVTQELTPLVDMQQDASFPDYDKSFDYF
jgi:hypothetical protein